ncbi:hypothetical protein TanjilG_21985 [Lupinus angustifolius]|uniref:THH1/TOM1/TOM3 domain-containing protein n=1 Tax=Lupinus angustifolius TaxID=3871 RepID=A0A394DCC6_LUPAN|nr:hypothetical protein TanjilG_21985 [Lupinus angustifolius]
MKRICEYKQKSGKVSNFLRMLRTCQSFARSEPTNKLRPAYFIVNGFITSYRQAYKSDLPAFIWIYMSVSRAAAGVEASKLFLAAISFIAALGFLLYGGRLFILLRHFPIESRDRQKKLYEVGSVTSVCCAGFLIRYVMLALSTFDENVDLVMS